MTTTFTVATLAGRHGASQRQRRIAIDQALSLSHPVLMSLTELFQDDDRATTGKSLAAQGYGIHGSTGWETGIAYDLERFTPADAGALLVHPGRGRAAAGDVMYPPRHLVWVRGLVDDNPQIDLTFFAWHTNTRKADEVTRDVKERELMATDAATEMHAAGTGPRLVLGGCDSNENDRPGVDRPQSAILAAANLQTVWDDLGEYPPTHDGSKGGPIDWLVRRKADKRLTFTGVQVFPLEGFDHHMVEAGVSVEPLPVPEHPCPTCGFVHPIQ